MTPYEVEAKRAVEELIEHGSNYRVEKLKGIYHPDLKIVEIDETGLVAAIDLADNLALFRDRRDRGVPPLSTDAEFNYVEANESSAHVVVTRRMQLGDRPEESVFSIHLARGNDRWQVHRETAFVRPTGGE